MVDKNLIYKLSELSKLEFNEYELEKISEELDTIIKFANKVKDFKIENHNENEEVIEYKNLRKDECIAGLSNSELTQNLQKRNENRFIVPEII